MSWECLHGPGAVCAGCSDLRPWWREARGGGDPPNDPPQRPVEVIVVANHNMPWTAEDDALLVGYGWIDEIAESLGRTVGAVRERRKVLRRARARQEQRQAVA